MNQNNYQQRAVKEFAMTDILWEMTLVVLHFSDHCNKQQLSLGPKG
jgi:hypothetical protein